MSNPTPTRNPSRDPETGQFMSGRVTPIAERFWPKVKKTDGCWLWTASTDRRGYGRIGRGRADEGNMFAHRLSWELHHGEPPPEDMNVCHHCDNPLCVNPDHLFLGAQEDNVRDMHDKGRGFVPEAPRGEEQHASVLTEEDVLTIRSRRAAGETYASIAEDYGVRPTTIYSVWKRKTWKHVGGPSSYAAGSVQQQMEVG